MCKQVLVIDLETTGVDARTDSIVQVAAVLLDARTLEEVDVYNTMVRPSTPISEGARAVHGLRESDLVSAPALSSALRTLARFASPDLRIAGHNVGFDAGFLRAGYASLGLDYPFDYHAVDVWSIAWFFLSRQGVVLRSYSLDQLRDYFALPVPEFHDALLDARASADVLRRVSSDIGAQDWLAHSA